MSGVTRIASVHVQNFRSIGECRVELGPLTFLLGSNGSGKSNFIDVFGFVLDGMTGALGRAIDARGGFDGLRRRTVRTRGGGGQQHKVGLRFDLVLPDGRTAYWACRLNQQRGGPAVVEHERIEIGQGPLFEGTVVDVERGVPTPRSGRATRRVGSPHGSGRTAAEPTRRRNTNRCLPGRWTRPKARRVRSFAKLERDLIGMIDMLASEGGRASGPERSG